MKIGLVRRGYSSTGGAEAYLLRFADAARAAGHDCSLFGSPEWAHTPWDGQKHIIPGRTPREFADALRTANPRNHCDYLFSLERVWKCDAYRAGDGVHAAWLQRRAAFEPWWKPLFRRLQRKHNELAQLERTLFTGGAKRIIANSQMVRDEITARFQTPADRITVIHNGIPPAQPQPDARKASRQKLHLAPDRFTLLFTGSGWERKGLRFAINALPENTTLLVAGAGKRHSLPSAEGVQFLGPQSRAEIDQLLAAADAFILPTLYEPFSNACLEALAAGLPVITTTANGFAEIIQPGIEGDIVEPGDIPALRAALRRWSDPERRAAVRQQLIEKGTRFSIEKNLRETLACIGI